MPRSKFEGDIFIISSEASKELRDEASNVGVTGVYEKGDTNELFERQSGKLVAYVDDSTSATIGASRFLEACGAEVVVYNDPTIALREIPDHIPPFAVVFSDLNMPKMNGIELAQNLRAGE